MQVLTGLLGGVIGGTLALIGGWLNDRRTQRNATHNRIRELAAIVERAAYMMEDCVLEAHSMWAVASGPAGGPAPRLDTNRYNLFEAELVGATVELAWLTRETNIAQRLNDVGATLSALFGHWGGAASEWATHDAQVRVARDALRDEIGAFVSMTQRRRRRYLAAKS